MLKHIQKAWGWFKLALVLGLILWITYAIVVVNKDMNEHGFWQVYGEPYYN